MREGKRAYNRAYYAKNRERLLALQAERDAKRAAQKRAYNRARSAILRAADPAGVAARAAASYVRRREKAQKAAREQYVRNRAAYILRARVRDGRLKHGALWTTQGEQVEIDGLYLFTGCFPWFEVDHIVPLNGKTVSGLHVLGNLQVLTSAQNRAKGNKFCPALVELVQATR